MIKEIMTKDIIVCDINDSISEVSDMMKKYDTGFLPVSDGNKIVGVITDRDIVIRAISNNASSDDKIENYITKDIIYIEDNKKIEDALDLMGSKKIKRLLVSNNKKLVGIIVLSNIINHHVEGDKLIDNLQKIFEINRNYNEFRPEIDEFYL